MPHPAQHIMLQEYIHSVEECTQRVHRLTEQILQLMPDWRMHPLVGALQALRGVAPVVAATAVAEIGPMGRFEKPRQLMAYLGLVPSESSSGGSVRRGAITKTGNGHARRALIEARPGLPSSGPHQPSDPQASRSRAGTDVGRSLGKRSCGSARGSEN